MSNFHMAMIRRLHSYIGSFIAPSVLFFALTGATQLFSLHEAHGRYQPPPLLEKLSSVHKDQEFSLGHHHEPSNSAEESKDEGAAPEENPAVDDDKTELSTLALKWFFLAVSICLVLSTILGLWMALMQTRSRRLVLALIFAGSLIPAGLLLL